MDRSASNIDPQEVAKFEAMADLWWQPRGEFKALHEINPVRLAYVTECAGMRGKKILDVGCGGGLLAEAMARQGARVTGIDMVSAALEAARRHAVENSVTVDYQTASAEIWSRDHAGRYDAVTCMELVEHVPDPASLVHACANLVRPGGSVIFATVNRTPLARLLVILVAEYLMGIVRKGTHTYEKFVRPEELAEWGRLAGLQMADLTGLRYIPVLGLARRCKSLQMNYMMHLIKTC